jgi:hypothetical protein
MFEINVTRRAALGGVAAMVLVSAFGENGAPSLAASMST